MKKLKNFLSIILAIMMVISIVPITASAAEPTFTITTDKSTVIAGDVITVSVSISDNSQIGALTLDLVYDSSMFEAISMVSYGIFPFEMVNQKYSNSKARFIGAVADTIVDGGILFTVELKVLKTSDSTISIDVVEAIDGDSNEVIVATNSVAIKAVVECKHEIMSNWAVTKVATCKKDGVETRNCTVCDYSETRAIPATGECSYKWIVTKRPQSCTEFGEKILKCTMCGDVKETQKITISHVYKTIYISASCMNDGEQYDMCENCGDIVNLTIIPALGHEYNKFIKKPTCTTNGIEYESCSNCGDRINEYTIPADGHDYEVHFVANPTCTEQGHTVYRCSACFDGYISDYVDATGHNYTWYTISVATCEIDGVMLGECSICEDVDVKAISKTGHNYENGVCENCGINEDNSSSGDKNEPDTPYAPEDTEFTFSIKDPSRTSIRHKDGIILHANIEGILPEGAYIKWTTDNDNFNIEESTDGKSLTIISANNGDTTITATVFDSSGNILITDTINMTSKAGFFDKIGSFFRSLFGSTKIYDN